MNGAQKVSPWPRIEAIMRPGPHRYEATLRVNGAATACAASTPEALRAGIIARCATLAQRLSRPVALDVDDQGQLYRLAVRPTGIVQAITAGEIIQDDPHLEPIAGPCRHCAEPVLVIETQCESCGEHDPLRVELEGFPAVRQPRPSAEPEPPAEPEPEPEPEPAVTVTREPEPAEASSELPDHTVFVRRRRPTLTINAEGARSVTVPAPAVIGRNPEPVDGHSPVVLPSAGRELSRTHVLVDVDDEGRLILTDQNSANGTYVDGHELAPHTPTIVHATARLALGDVRVEVRSSVSSNAKAPN